MIYMFGCYSQSHDHSLSSSFPFIVQLEETLVVHSLLLHFSSLFDELIRKLGFIIIIIIKKVQVTCVVLEQ